MTTVSKLPRNYLTIITHVSLWVVFLGAPILFEPGGPNEIPMVMRDFPPPEIRRSVGVALNLALITLFYLNYSLFLPCFYLKGKVWQYFLAILSAYCTFQLIGFLLRNYLFKYIFHIPVQETVAQLSIIFSTIFFVLMWAASSGFRLNDEWRRTENQRRETESRRLEAELALLKSQINPHFLLNSLNNLYALSLTQPDKTPDALLKLSEMVAYILHECNRPKVPLAHDLKFLENYLALQRLRLPPNIVPNVSLPQHIPDLDIEPMILITFVENAFKHGLTTKQPCTIEVSVQIESNNLTLKVENPVLPAKNEQINNPQGIGIANTTTRLTHAYPEKHRLDIKNDGTVYKVKLEIEL